MPSGGEIYGTGQAVATAIVAPTPWNIGRAAAKVGSLIGLGKKKKRPLSGDINLDAMTVDICGLNPKYCRKHPKHAARYNSALTGYLRGTSGDPGFKRDSYLLSVIDQVRDQMRVRPFTQVESVAWGSSTPASQLLASQLAGRRGGLRSAAKRRRKKKAVRGVRRVRRGAKRTRARSAGRRGRGARLVKGSTAARRHMSRLRNMRRRK
jgi:hypothetical protein